jgi:hypothetical protein
MGNCAVKQKIKVVICNHFFFLRRRPRRRRVRNRFPWNNFSLCVVFSLIFFMGLVWFYFTLIEALDSKEFEKAALLVLNNNRPVTLFLFCFCFVLSNEI